MLKIHRKLVALPVPGEAFLLRRERCNILVDSGINGEKLAESLVQQSPKLTTIKIAVCTHADRDHAGGFTTLLDEWPSENKRERIQEFWLPGIWSIVVDGLTKDPFEYADALLSEMISFARKYQDIDSEVKIDAKLLKDFKSLLEDDPPHDPLRDERLRTRDKIESGERSDNRNIDDKSIDSVIRNARRVIDWCIDNNLVSAAVGGYWHDLFKTAKRISRIARSADRHNVKIRWFDYGKFEDNGWRPQGGDPDLLIPVNAVEKKPTPTNLMKSYLLRLTVRNEQCLSFYSPGSKCEAGVLFCGDSPMGYNKGYSTPFTLPKPSPAPLVIATAPHHGSKSNSLAYCHILKQIMTVPTFWIRSGGDSGQPGNVFRSIPARCRLCTWCPRSGIRPKVQKFVKLHFRGTLFVSKGHPCNCKPEGRDDAAIASSVRRWLTKARSVYSVLRVKRVSR